MGQICHQQCDRGAVEIDRWTVDRPEVRVDPITISPFPFAGAPILRERITMQDIVEFGANVGCPRFNAIKDNERAQAHSDRCRLRIEECLRATPQGAAIWVEEVM